MTQDLKLIGHDPQLAQAFVTCLESIGIERDLSGPREPSGFQQKAALCAFRVLDESAYKQLDGSAALGGYVQSDLAELLGLLQSVRVRPPYRWRAGKAQATVHSNIGGDTQVISTPDIVKVDATANGIDLEVVEVAGVHILFVSRQSVDILGAPPAARGAIVRDTLRRLLRDQDDAIDQLRIPEKLEEGTYFCQHELPDSAWLGLGIPDVGLHVGILDNRIYVVLPKLPASPGDRPVVFRGIDPCAYIYPTLKEANEK